MTELIDTTEMYLKTVYELEEDGVPPLRARIVERLDHSGPTVSQTVARMERDGLIKVAEDRSLELTDEGRRRATDVIRKHRLAERLLLDVIGIERRFVHDEACRWEHVMSEQVEERLADILDDVSTDPFGNPVPRSTRGPLPMRSVRTASPDATPSRPSSVASGSRFRPTRRSLPGSRTHRSSPVPRWSCVSVPAECASSGPPVIPSSWPTTSPATSSCGAERRRSTCLSAPSREPENTLCRQRI